MIEFITLRHLNLFDIVLIKLIEMLTKKNFTFSKQTLNKMMCEQLMSCIKYFILQQSF